MIEIMASSNVEIPTEANIKYTGQIETEYEQELPTIASMTPGSKIYIKVEGEEGQKITFRTKDGSIIDKDNSIYQVEANSRILFIVGKEKYSVFEYPSIQPSTVDPSVVNELKNDILTNANEIVEVNTKLTKTTNDVAQLMSDMVDVQATTQGNNSQLTVHSTEISALNSKASDLETSYNANKSLINTNITELSQLASSQVAINQVLTNHTVQMDKNTTDITAFDESIQGLQETTSRILTQASGFSRRYYNFGFEIEKGQAEHTFLPDTVKNEAWLNPTQGGYNLQQGKEYILDARFVSNTELSTGSLISFELLDGSGQGVFDINNVLMRDVSEALIGEAVGEYRLQGTFIPDESGIFKVNINCTPELSENAIVLAEDNSLLIYEHSGLILFIKTLLNIQ